MKVEKAIEELTELLINARIDGDLRRSQVLRLAIEALERCGSNYLNPQRADFRRLPGETEE